MWLSVSKSCPTLCTLGFPVLHYLPELAQTQVHWVGDAIQPSHPLSPSSPPAFNLSQHQGLFQWVGCSHQVAKLLASASVLLMNIQGWFPLGLTGLISLQFKGLSRVFSSTRKSFGTQPSLGFPGDASGKEPTCQCRRHKRHRFDPWVGKIPWRRKWQPTPVFLPGESQGQRSLVGCGLWGRTESDTTEAT